MRPVRLLLQLFSLSVFQPFLLPAAPPLQPPPKLVALPKPGLRMVAQNLADYEFGRINFLDTPQIEHVFTVRHEGNAPATLTQLQTTCHCTHVDLLEIAGRKTSLVEQPVFLLEPGQEMKIKMTVHLARQVPGHIAQSVYLYADGFNAPIFTLRLSCELEHGLTVSPSSLDFGAVKAGETQSRKITLTYDPRLVGAAALPTLTSQCDPHIAPKTDSLITITPTKESPAPSISDSKLRTQTYTITIKPSQAGDLAARLYFPDLSPSDYHGTIPFETAAEIYRSLTIPVLALVVEK
ncbi:MAG: DUF1573 domain-containing protein [Nibricoccus sp.]